MTCDSIHTHTFVLPQDNKISVRTVCLCAVCALNEMNACAPPLPNYREWRGEISGKKERRVVTQAGIGEKNDVQ